MNNVDEKLVERLISRIEQLNTDILKKIGKTIGEIKNLTPTQAHQLEKILKYGQNYNDIVKELSKVSNVNVDEINQIFNAYAKQDYDFAKDFYDYKGIVYKSYKDFELLNQQVKALSKMAINDYLQISKTKALGFTITDLDGKVKFKQLKEAYQYAIDQAVLSISQGKDTFDSQMFNILKGYGSGLKVMDYDNGRARRLDSIIRMHLSDSLRNLHNATQEIIGQDFGSDGVEITVHEYPAPDHEDLQGKQFSFKEFDKLQDNLPAKDYKGREYAHEHRPISQLNCYHTTFAIVLGVSKPQYTDEQLQQIKERNEKGFDFEGKHYTMYEGTQLQRRIETEIRKQKDTQILAKEADNKQLIGDSQYKITQLTSKYKQLSNASGLSMKQDRLRVSGYKRTKVEIEKPNKIEYKVADDKLIDKYYKKAEETKNTLSNDEVKAIKNYTGVGFKEINEYLENGTTLYDVYNNDIGIQNDITNIENAINKNTIDDNIIVFKGTSNELWNEYKIGEEVEMPVFNSTSLNEKIAHRFAKHYSFQGKEKAILEIRVPKGTKGVSIGDFYATQNEQEILLNKNTKYRIIDKKIIDPSHYEGDVYVRDVKYAKYIMEVIK